MQKNTQTAEFAEQEMKCPHCKAKLTLREAIIILNGSGLKKMAQIRLVSGEIAYLDAGQVNPNTVELIG
jgi:hypothetical protein